ncbi:MAG TPA: caspase family protein [Leptolyngbya sp.]|jgi:hypothetical protein|nr:caspase family protein [Leptolyngbya sp.]
MSNYWAIAIGVNHYQFLQPLHFAQPDAQSLCESLVSDAGFLPDHCLLLTDTSPKIADQSTDPTYENLQYWVGFLKDKLQPTDRLWCYFSGYGICVEGEDYLLPIDAAVDRVKETGFSVRSLFQILRSLPTQNIFMLLDINRSASVSNEKVGAETAALAHESGISTLLSCRPEQFSHESSAYNHGLFTQALLEGLRSHQCSTLATLEEFLKTRLPELCDHSDQPVQDPILIVSDPDALYQMIMPVNWAETESWIPAGSNPFAIEEDLYLHSSDPDPVRHPFGDQPTVMGATADNFSDEEIPEQYQLEPVTIEPEPILELSLPDESIEPAYPVPDLSLPDEPIDPESPIVDPTPQDPQRDQRFWEQLLFGGSALLLILLLGVLFRNWSAFMGNPQTANNPVPTETIAPSASLAPPTKGSAQVLNEARSLIKPVLASDAIRAIERARTIPPTDPLYAEAQQDIDRWSRDILEIAQKRAAQGNFSQAIAAAQLVPNDRPQVHAEAQKAIQQWRKAK